MDKFRARLAKWKGKLLSLGGRITVFNRLSIFLLSFYKAPTKIWNDIEKIQKQLLWGDFESKRKIHWVRWEHICYPFSLGGLAVKNIKSFNLTLLLKWK